MQHIRTWNKLCFSTGAHRSLYEGLIRKDNKTVTGMYQLLKS